MNRVFSDLVERRDGREALAPEVHPLPGLLDMDAEAVLESFRTSQIADFEAVINGLEAADNPLRRFFDDLAAHGPAVLGPAVQGGAALADPARLRRMFLDLHLHVMSHPVWRHPFFVRVFEGRAGLDDLRRFAVQYFNQIKNTRQCVALALGRFNGTLAYGHGALDERLSEITQIVLAQLLADEYGVGVHGLDDYPGLAALFGSKTHIVMYRQLLDGLGVAPGDQDVPMIPAVADNVLIQRLVAGDAAFSPLEALASVGLGMEWGVPEFFSLLLGGFIRIARREGLALTRHHLEVLSAHVRYDVLHAISVMVVTAVHAWGPEDEARIRQATNTLMAGRYGMMSGLYRHVFGEDCPSLGDLAAAGRLDPAYTLTDRRIETALRTARAGIAPGRLAAAAGAEMPFVFAT